jgi:hypothetical protein
MSIPTVATPSATIISINAHPSRFSVGTFAHHVTLGFCEIVGLPAQFGQRTVRWESHHGDYAQIQTVDVAVEALQELTEWREFRGMLATRG